MCRYHHVSGAIHITPSGLIKLRSRPWVYKLMPSLSHHGMAQYHVGMSLLVPDFLKEIAGLNKDDDQSRSAQLKDAKLPQDRLHASEESDRGELALGRSSVGVYFWRCISASNDQAQ